MPMRSNSRKSTVDSRKSTVDSRKSTVGVIVLLLYVALAFRPAVSAQQYTFEEVASGLTHKDVNTRLRAIQILKDADYAEAAGPIAATLEDSDDRVQLAAIDAERSLFMARVVPRRKKIGLVVEIRTIAGGDAAAAGQLALKARRVPTQLLSSLAVALRDSNPRVRAEAINLASLVGPYACVAVRLKPDPADIARPEGPSSRVRLDGDRDSCTNIGNALVDNINSREPLLRRAAMQALGQLRYPNAVQALSDQFSYRQKGLDGMAALEGLAGIGHPTSVSIFEGLLTSKNADMRRLAVEGLARTMNRDVLSTLQQMGQEERSNGVLLALHYANAKLGGIESSLQQIVAGLGNAAQRPLVLGYLLDLSTSMAPAIAGALTDQSEDVRRLVADVLGFSGNTAVLPALEGAAKDSDPDVAAAAQQAIERLKL
ncbi:MAG TPA: HEAT repeat domain-containing protein [Vicinamibacterales bacterium]|nr:HEAT repeat domain-containing protein [Vicinamibacterales bacterium]